MSNQADIQRAKSIVSFERAQLERRVEAATGYGYDNVLVMYWPDIAQDDCDLCVRYLRGLSSPVTDPIVSNQKREGSWYVGPAEERQNPQTKNKDVYLTLFRGGASISAFLVEDNCAFEVERTLYLNSPTKPTLPTVGADNTAGISYRMSELLVDPLKGTWTGWIDKRTRQYQNLEWTQEDNLFETTVGREQKGVTDQTVPDASNPAVGTLIRQTQSKNQDCSKDVDTKTVTANEVTVAVKVTELNAFESVTKIVDRNESAAATPEVTQTAGQVVTRQSEKNQFQLYDNTETTRVAVAVDDAIKETEIRAFESVVRLTDKNLAAAATFPGSQTAGAITTTRDTLTEALRHDVQTETRTAVEVDDAVQEKQIDRYETRTKDIDRNKTAAATLESSQTTGQIVTTTSQKNDFARFDHETVTRVATEVTEAVKTTEVTLFGTKTTTLDRNETAAEATPSFSTGTVKRVKVDKNDFKLFDNTVETDTPSAVSDTEKGREVTLFETRDRAIDRNQSTAIATNITHADGYIDEQVARKTDAGLFDNIDQRRTANAVADSEVVSTATAFETRTETTDRNQTTAATPVTSVSPAGTLTTARSQKNDFGRYDNLVVERVAVAVASASTEETSDKFSTASKTLNRNASATTALPSRTDGDPIKVVRNIKTEANLYDVEVTTETPVAFDSGWISYADPNGTSYFRIFRNQTTAFVNAVASAMTAATNNSIDASANRFGLFDGRATRAAAGGASGSLDFATGYNVDINDIVADTFDEYYVKVKYSASFITIRDFVTAGAVATLGAGYSKIPGKGKYSTGVNYLGRGVWQGVMVGGK